MSVKRRDLIKYLEEKEFYLLREASSPKMPAILILNRNVHHCTLGRVLPGSAGVSPAPEAAKMATLPGGSGTVMTRDYGCLPHREPK